MWPVITKPANLGHTDKLLLLCRIGRISLHSKPCWGVKKKKLSHVTWSSSLHVPRSLVCRNKAFLLEEDTKLHRRQAGVWKARVRDSLSF